MKNERANTAYWPRGARMPINTDTKWKMRDRLTERLLIGRVYTDGENHDFQARFVKPVRTRP